jgi:predicted Ser/Thr protein kinase
MSSDTKEGLSTLLEGYKERFEANKRILTFREYLALVSQVPSRYVRDAARFVRDAFKHYGTYPVDRPWGQTQRYALFDLPFDDGKDKLIGQEDAQEAIYRALENYVSEGQVDRLLVLNGPNGSAKSTLIGAIMRALEHYSAEDEGALYTFNWVFPSRATMSRIGFGGDGRQWEQAESFAHLLDEDVDARLRCEVRDHPLLLLPQPDRISLLRDLTEQGGQEMPRLPELILRGGLCQKCRQVFDALVAAYHGDLSKVLQHVQVERWFVSRPYRMGAVTIGPQLSVDAGERQVSADRSLASLPSSLQMTTLFEPHGELVDASGGLLEYSDLLKRPIDAFRYLLSTIETGEVSLVQSILRLNTVLIATTNDAHLAAFREHPEYASFRGRLSVVRVPYLLDYPTEKAIYDSRVVPNIRRHVAPHAMEAAARWAVGTRLRSPNAGNYDENLRQVLKELTAAQKAELYASGKVPVQLKGQRAEELRSSIGALYRESDTEVQYEGRYGASPREIRAVLLAAAQDTQSECLSPRSVIRHLEALCERKAEHAFLQRKAQKGSYEGVKELLADVRTAVLDGIEEELRTATGFVADDRHLGLLEKYVLHVRHWVKGEKLFNKVTGGDEEPDVSLMQGVEQRLAISEAKAQDFRRAIISAIAGYAIEHPGQVVKVETVFPDYLATLRASYYAEHRQRVADVGADVLSLLSGDKIASHEARVSAEKALDVLRGQFGYCDHCLTEALGDLIRARY